MSKEYSASASLKTNLWTFFYGAFPANIFLEFNLTLTANNYGLNQLTHHVSYIFIKLRTSSFTWFYTSYFSHVQMKPSPKKTENYFFTLQHCEHVNKYFSLFFSLCKIFDAVLWLVFNLSPQIFHILPVDCLNCIDFLKM